MLRAVTRRSADIACGGHSSYLSTTHSHPDKRKAEAERIRQKYSDRIPVICEKVEKSDIPTIDKKKYLVPADLTVGQFVYVIRKRIKLSPEKAIFIFVDDILPPTAALMSAIYEEHKWVCVGHLTAGTRTASCTSCTHQRTRLASGLSCRSRRRCRSAVVL